jgi:hypothetical protein
MRDPEMSLAGPIRRVGLASLHHIMLLVWTGGLTQTQQPNTRRAGKPNGSRPVGAGCSRLAQKQLTKLLQKKQMIPPLRQHQWGTKERRVSADEGSIPGLGWCARRGQNDILGAWGCKNCKSSEGKLLQMEQISCHSHGHPGKTGRQRTIAGMLMAPRVVNRARVEQNARWMPDIWTVLKRDKKDLRRMAVVLEAKHGMVQIGCHDIATGAQKERYKRPSPCLIYLENGLEMVNGAKSQVWILKQRMWKKDPEDQEQRQNM